MSVYDTILELLLQKYDKTEEKKESDRLSQQILTLLQDPKVMEFRCLKKSFPNVFLGWS